ncbi:putative nucleoside transporter 1 [Trypanosoma rangeli]|uniref:Putative nucleoside transporter 1 n=1 Tax=Trypanosoma rangeli TaxID=5698 RepID=A0A422N8M2_TRYRA|nr:putative nucleoside transporter 1 [Trypanosoma rangeli]RNF01807.1 putative nucleoside transporter 1 [Trypanosoma rangeli]|eukprot:RNF01807.1 putative nucleoside transporter 1 [Trypanosoma rangeli]
MAVLGFNSYSEVIVYLTFLFFGVSIMMVSNAIMAAPSFIMEFYKYAKGEKDTKADDPLFWANVLTYYNVAVFGMQVVCEVFMLTPLGRSIPLRPRLIVGLIIPIAEMLTLVLVPLGHTGEAGAKATIMVVAIVSGISKTLCDSSTGALAGPFPTKFYGSVVLGLGFSGIISSAMALTIKGSMADDFESVQTQSRIYIGVSIGIQVLSCLLLVVMPRNPFARKYTAEFRYMHDHQEGHAHTDDNEISMSNVKEQEVSPVPNEHTIPFSGAEHNMDVMHVVGDADNVKDIDQVDNITSTQQMLNAQIIVVFKCIWPMLLSCFVVFGATLFLFPGVFFAAGSPKGWYTTIVVAMFNLGDFLSRCLLLFKRLHPSPRVVLAGSFLRVLIVPLLVLCVRKIIPGEVLPHILCLIWGLTNGYYGGMAMIHCTRTPSLVMAGQRSIASIMASLALLLGLFLGSSLATGVLRWLPR